MLFEPVHIFKTSYEIHFILQYYEIDVNEETIKAKANVL